MQKILVVVDMQKDFINGSLGTKEAQAIVKSVKNKIEDFEGRIFFTRDTHTSDYMETQEGKRLPVEHCVRGTDGWQISSELPIGDAEVIDKPTFGSRRLAERILELHTAEGVESVTLVGLCTDICVISNALLIKAFLPEVEIRVDSACCAGVTPESHQNALSAMRMCQITVE